MRPETVRRTFLPSILAVAIAACGSPAASFPAVAPTVDAVEALGYDCGDPGRDNVPSGTFHWACQGDLNGVRSSVLVDGNSEGVMEVHLVVYDPEDPPLAAGEFRRLAAAVPPLNRAPDLAGAVYEWTGTRQEHRGGGAVAWAECNPYQCIVHVASADGPLEPLALP